MPWDPKQYERYAAERAQPFWDLAALVEPTGIDVAADLGCGSGALTAAAAERFGVADMTGFDTSMSMLAEAARLERPGLRFRAGDIATWTAEEDHDLVIANASLHWVPDHAAVLARWIAALRPGGQLAVQVPANADHPAHLAVADVAAREPFASAFGDAGPPPDPVARNVLVPEAYAVLLHDLGIARPHVRLQVYLHELASTNDVVEWVRGTTLTRVFDRLPAEFHASFVEAYREVVRSHLGIRAPYCYSFKRILMAGRRA
jgi:trans-aconitate 2-methyltransferase